MMMEWIEVQVMMEWMERDAGDHGVDGDAGEAGRSCCTLSFCEKQEIAWRCLFMPPLSIKPPSTEQLPDLHFFLTVPFFLSHQAAPQLGAWS